VAVHKHTTLFKCDAQHLLTRSLTPCAAAICRYNYRGVVLGYDQRPIMDVSGWDGVVDLPSGEDQPFYHVLPDDNDCIEAFGAPRSWRYCAQENLQMLEPPPAAAAADGSTAAATQDTDAGSLGLGSGGDDELAAVLAAAGLSLPTGSGGWSQFEEITHEQLDRLFERFDRERGRCAYHYHCHCRCRNRNATQD
jgi:hemimethylated DNA binding protein